MMHALGGNFIETRPFILSCAYLEIAREAARHDFSGYSYYLDTEC